MVASGATRGSVFCQRIPQHVDWIIRGSVHQPSTGGQPTLPPEQVIPPEF